mmetsp:Transcript_8818/g.11115  ORF Transcript_8818/g.11115 Transcript_8818/m.11115 type:complete len:108 (-) Transcript_8818:163-486(-)
MLDVYLIKGKHSIPDDYPEVSIHGEEFVKGDIRNTANKQEKKTQPRPPTWELSTKIFVLQQGNNQRCTHSENDERLYVGVLQDLNIRENSGKECKGYDIESFDLVHF